MKHLLIYLAAINLSLAFSKKPTKPEEPQAPVSAKPDIKALASKSPCGKISWKDRGKAPVSYTEGMAESFFHLACNKESLTYKEFSRPLGTSSKDAITYYKINPKNETERVLATQTLLHGLGMRESSGKHCEGRDGSAGNVTASTAEAGLFQTSYNSVNAAPSLKALFEIYSGGHSDVCYLSTFKQGVSCGAKDAINYGAGNGRKFQELAKTCPAFAVFYAGLTLRYLRQHYGPVNRKEVEYRLECQKMYASLLELATPTNCRP